MGINIEESLILDWCGSSEIVAEGRQFSNDPKEFVHHVMLGSNAVRVWVDVARKSEAFLWRLTSAMTIIEEAIGGNITWPTDKVIMRQVKWPHYSYFYELCLFGYCGNKKQLLY